MSHLNPLGATRTPDDSKPRLMLSQQVAEMEADLLAARLHLQKAAEDFERMAQDLRQRAESLRTHIPR